MTERIQGVPRGLLSAFGIVGGGEAQRELAETVVPTADIAPHYDAGQLEVAFAQVLGITVAGANVQLVVPAGEFWRVYAVEGTSVGLAAGADLQLSVQLAVNPGGNAVTVFGSENVPVAGALGDGHRIGGPLPVPVVLAGGSVINGQKNRLGTAVNLHIAALIRRLTA